MARYINKCEQLWIGGEAMAASKEWAEWHLTRSGWVRGSYETDSNSATVGPPADRVLTCEYRQRMQNFDSKIQEDRGTIWRHPDEGLIRPLLDQFGPCPGRIV
jgi:hypothetical protein